MKKLFFLCVVCVLIGLSTAQPGYVLVSNGEIISNPKVEYFETQGDKVTNPQGPTMRDSSNSSLDYRCVSGGMFDSTCDVTCFKPGNSRVRKCGGDPKFCQKFGCDPNPDCACYIYEVSTSFQTVSSRLEVTRIWNNETYQIPSFTENFSKRNILSERDFLGDIEISLSGEELTVTVDPPDMAQIVLRKRKYVEQWFFTGYWSGNLKEDLFLTTDYLIIEIWINGQMEEREEHYIIGRSKCIMSDCFFCYATFEAWNCLQGVQRLFLIALMLVSVFFILAFMPVIIWLSYWILSSIWAVICFIFKAIIYINKTPVGIAVSMFISKTWNKKKVFEPVETPQQKQSFGGGRKLDAKDTFFFVLCLICIASAQLGCSGGIFLSGQISQCVQTSPTKETCSYVSQTVITLNGIGSTVCFSVVDPSNNATITDGRLEFQSEIQTVGTNFLYSTADWRLSSCSVRKCAERSSCPEDCESSYPAKLFVDPITNDCPTEVINWPGQAICSRFGDGCVPNGCLSCNDPCVFSAYSLIPNSSPEENGDVFDFAQVTRKPELVWYGNGEAYTIRLQETTTVGYLKITPIGSLSMPPTDFGTRKLIKRRDGVVFLGYGAEVNSPVSLGIGDIQAQSPSNLFSTSLGAFIYPTDAVTVTHRSNSDEYSSVSPGWRVLKDYPSLPTVFNGNTWNIVNGNFQSSLSTSAPLLVTMETDANFKVTRTLQAVCPKFNIKEITGCYDCQLGITIIIEGWSACMPGFATVSVQDNSNVEISTVSVGLAIQHSNITINAYTSAKTNSGSLCLTGTGGKECKSFDFIASGSTVVDPGFNETEGNNTKVKSKDFKWSGLFTNFSHHFPRFFKDLFSGDGTIVMWIVFAGTLSVLTIGAIVGMIYSWPLVEPAIQLMKLKFLSKPKTS